MLTDTPKRIPRHHGSPVIAWKGDEEQWCAHMSEAARFLGVNASRVFKMLKEPHRKTREGWKVRWADTPKRVSAEPGKPGLQPGEPNLDHHCRVMPGWEPMSRERANVRAAAAKGVVLPCSTSDGWHVTPVPA